MKNETCPPLAVGSTAPVGRLSWEVYVDCPHCAETFDAAAEDSEHELAKAIFTNAWDAVKGMEVVCPKCRHEFELGGVEY